MCDVKHVILLCRILENLIPKPEQAQQLQEMRRENEGIPFAHPEEYSSSSTQTYFNLRTLWSVNNYLEIRISFYNKFPSHFTMLITVSNEFRFVRISVCLNLLQVYVWVEFEADVHGTAPQHLALFKYVRFFVGTGENIPIVCLRSIITIYIRFTSYNHVLYKQFSCVYVSSQSIFIIFEFWKLREEN